MTTPTPPPGWYPDPAGGGGHRWWDGNTWSSNTSPPAAQPVAAGYGATTGQVGAIQPASAAAMPQNPGYSPYQPVPASYAGTGTRAQSGNRLALITLGVVALYLVIAFETRFVIFGFLPLALSLRSRRQREPLAPLAIGAAVLAIVVAAVRLFGH
jgi:hypothetical protein